MVGDSVIVPQVVVQVNMVSSHHKQQDRYNNLLYRMHMVLFLPTKILYFLKINHLSNKSEFRETVLLNILNKIVPPKSTCQHIHNTLTYINEAFHGV